jgi:hypothetical protein
MKRFGWIILMAVILAGVADAQTNPPPPGPPAFYRLDFTLKEMEAGKVVSSRAYQMMVRTDDNAMSSIRAGGRVPVNSDKNSFTYIDVGVNIDVKRMTRVQDELMLDVTAEASGAVDGTTPPVVRQTKWNSTVLIPIRKSVTIFSSDDPASKRQIQLDLTATPVK